MPEFFTLIFSAAILWNSVYLISYALYEKKSGNLGGFVGICLILATVLYMFSLNFIKI